MQSLLSPRVRAILQSLDDPEKLLGAVLDLALFQTGAVRGLVCDREQVVRAVGYDHAGKMRVWRILKPFFVDCGGVLRSGRPFFAAAGVQASGPVVGIAGVLTGTVGNLAILAVEKDTPLEETEIAEFGAWLQLASTPVAVALANARMNRIIQHAPLRLSDLPLEDLAHLPNIEQVEMLLIAHAMRRNQNHKGKVAAELGISREGLRRKLLRAHSGE